MSFPFARLPLGSKSPKFLLLTYIFFGLLFLLWFYRYLRLNEFASSGYGWRNSFSRPQTHFGEDVSLDAHNSTLGFGKAFYISLPSRTDRQDAMELLAAMSNLHLTYQPGVDGKLISDKAKPEYSENLRPEQLGCWRGHADVWKKVLEEDLETALVLEDDVDWDVNIHGAFEELSRQMRKNKLRTTRPSQREIDAAPYGLDWDILYVGSCWDIPNADNRPPHQSYFDQYAPGKAELAGTFSSELEGWGLGVTNETQWRVLAPSWYPVCTLGYAVTRRGAERLLYNIGGYRGMGAPIDLAMIDLVQKNIAEAYTIIPPLITTFHTGGFRDSDIDGEEKYAKNITGWEGGVSENLKLSARAALKAKLGPKEDKQ